MRVSTAKPPPLADVRSRARWLGLAPSCGWLHAGVAASGSLIPYTLCASVARLARPPPARPALTFVAVLGLTGLPQEFSVIVITVICSGELENEVGRLETG